MGSKDLRSFTTVSQLAKRNAGHKVAGKEMNLSSQFTCQYFKHGLTSRKTNIFFKRLYITDIIVFFSVKHCDNNMSVSMSVISKS